MSYDPTQVAFVDCETTGLDPEYHVVWEIAVIIDGEEHVWQQTVGTNALSDADPVALKMNGFAERYNVGTEPLPPTHSIRLFESYIGNRHIVGACPWFDSERLHKMHRNTIQPWDCTHAEYIERRRHPWHYHLIDVEALAIGYMMGEYIADSDGYPDSLGKAGLPWRSGELSRYLGVDPDGFPPKHTALADARWAKAMFEAVMGAPE